MVFDQDFHLCQIQVPMNYDKTSRMLVKPGVRIQSLDPRNLRHSR